MTLGGVLAEAVVFDLDGVLVDSERVNVASAIAAFEGSGMMLEPDAPSRIVGRHPVDYVPELAEPFGMPADEQRMLMERQGGIYHRLWDEQARLFVGARPTLITLRDRGFRLALATSAGRAHVSRCLERFDLGGLFEVVSTCDDVSRRKPDPEVYLRTFEALGIAPTAAGVVEDSAHGVRAAVASGAACILVRSRFTSEDSEHAATVVVDTVGDVPDWLRR